MNDDEPMIIDTSLRTRIHAMSTEELYKYVWELYNKLKKEEKM